MGSQNKAGLTAVVELQVLARHVRQLHALELLHQINHWVDKDEIIVLKGSSSDVSCTPSYSCIE